ncbi:hypothetical protein KIPB_001874 [Kipferlia bialata]|uniref:Uncharacterized protein n=1 Tax=Kipferlia bialata TaxID=797122 RepID=A0A9K3GEF9_9EUKA|nr:hypothetical protein KIPB_000662 [Kipferlia bialata]GIQ80960.1 hypothetical protein KIPB_001846 [Kipferlia bialata]GIQ80974.1 hypothetical protein KIPB_001862 [Kipferlia bialata]GIQ80984.1 hypothetical protein KIPB_001874 [Kipferlia bialata]|eukprot:g662.t1
MPRPITIEDLLGAYDKVLALESTDTEGLGRIRPVPLTHNVCFDLAGRRFLELVTTNEGQQRLSVAESGYTPCPFPHNIDSGCVHEGILYLYLNKGSVRLYQLDSDMWSELTADTVPARKGPDDYTPMVGISL